MAAPQLLLYNATVYNIDLQKISSLISQKLDRTVELVGIEKIGSGYHSDGFKLTAKDGHSFFLKRIKSHDLGFEIPERKVMSLLISNGMYRRSGFQPQSVGVILENKDEAGIIPEVNEETAIYHVQEFQSDSVSYWSLLQEKKRKAKVDEKDLAELEKITDYIIAIHQVKHASQDLERLKSVYNDGLRSVLTSPELTVMLLHDFSDTHQLLPAGEHGNYVGLMLNLIHKWKDRCDRLVALHGDFWGANLFFKKDGSIWVIDYSRIPWGDRGVDIGWWLSQYLWFYHETQNEYFKELGEKFLDMYVEKSGDKEIRQTVSLVLGLMGIIYISPRFYPDLNMEIGKRFFDNILEILRGHQFVWKK
ncbi:MAG: hypothetical protein A3C80_04380 [Candidatus Ryanbacteria bacterium RIFCSPHIGHO2_02_FULL_45_43]|uniref:Aminoglycoside phosphotransferase domain-containing protein n=1 Tax=Candidatus Ryanbacteria bacterium RIFCSPHIGHO2_01_45_13 TaxID=1802112 RepID=A0A1G2FX48_9BACT|nr:MAG: hypothetical protein A2W41_00505 [Candidatus Ryanbacteria bacterium RIFCSPHIGHO2_01_45_13]OGZ42619.1 MAG: hypothetical protein A2718_04280 [Candidatus Ryanbacteria bacterium RIFCSPHIGHO2_01_FULL_44_130]OGZ49113.1 MAG: hypothetical protein A3C80_04380 [Candidatus Ryanbacteria bacterium RIFCSPHIGHO2_02_FULL_45_43]OGZ50485.1 MAG: hypothetical protein A3E55_02055 [Candidatus Ryanbacteria bacterium RIFCSPHIGHO2_12_FULL_44_20]OGZ51372.1 MAG: hypothetical protein A3A17_00075 [Candidatus Ryanba